ncbi:cystathionine gamma-lyase [Sulfobacillus acidophilus TPY]|uniref:Cys/Met metabolism pyridoxal-phosphate-dependent protein n=1 Tax=Sulfobacillus acidophilus (strain ATCC 700253 / DSM 10332 / NAL) TaxID=679936 RepID=G8TY21_SULAD|nr:cystathionine gamma-lyase [Sulfobacillus acidophilus TPY]AEW03928.1 Cys/Met metabolism pyridoxal-phosphate-dependent protein [Sulfobacillus acidophilus DSM 10332]
MTHPTNLTGFNTRAIHVGQSPDPTTGATIPPIYVSSTYTQDGLGQHRGYEYGRGDNPTREALEAALASLEDGDFAVTFASGMAAGDSILRMLKPGDEVVAGLDLYGGVYRLLETVYRPHHHTQVRYIDLTRIDAVPASLSEKTRILWVETPSNPLLQVADIQALATVAHESGALLVVDNTFASPYLQNPLHWGADLVVHSMTKYIAGHSDAIGGAVLGRDPSLGEHLRFIRNAAGATLGPFEAWLILRGLKTLGVRMDRHVANAERVADFLAHHPAVARVYYPGHWTEEAGRIVARQMRAPGGMVSFEVHSALAPDLAAMGRLFTRFRVFSLAESLGGVESLVGHPATMTHAALPAFVRSERGIRDQLIRLSVGIEDYADLEADLRLALDALLEA